MYGTEGINAVDLDVLLDLDAVDEVCAPPVVRLGSWR
jgi:hypothetical protein